MKPFDLAKAKAGAKLVNRAGYEAKIVYFEDSVFFDDEVNTNTLCYAYKIGQNCLPRFVHVNSITGYVSVQDLYQDKEYIFGNKEDLFLASEKRECWVISRQIEDPSSEGGWCIHTKVVYEEPKYSLDDAFDSDKLDIININHIVWED